MKSKNGRRFAEPNQSAREARYNARGAKRRALDDLVSVQRLAKRLAQWIAKKMWPGGEKVSEKGSGNLSKLDMGLAGQSGGSGQLCKRDMGLAGQSGGGVQLVKLDMGLARKSGNSPGSGSPLESVRHGLKMRFRQ